MVAIGVLYLMFEQKLLQKSLLPGDTSAPADNSLSRSLIGAQVSYSRVRIARSLAEPLDRLALSFWP